MPLRRVDVSRPTSERSAVVVTSNNVAGTAQTTRNHILGTITAVAMLLTPTGSHGDEPKPPEGFRTLFNGKDPEGWYGLNPHSVAKLTGEKKDANLEEQRSAFSQNWRVENGELVNDGHVPYATSIEEFGDIELLLEYKTVTKADICCPHG